MRVFLDHNRWATCLVIALFLLATSGAAVNRMTCLLGGHSIVSLGAAADCCPEQDHGTGPAFKGVCCVLSTVHGVQADYLSHPTMELAPDLLWVECLVLPDIRSEAAQVPSWLATRPPPLTGADRLVGIGVQRV